MTRGSYHLGGIMELKKGVAAIVMDNIGVKAKEVKGVTVPRRVTATCKFCNRPSDYKITFIGHNYEKKRTHLCRSCFAGRKAAIWAIMRKELDNLLPVYDYAEPQKPSALKTPPKGKGIEILGDLHEKGR